MVKHDQKGREFWKSSFSGVLVTSLEMIPYQCKRHYKWHCSDNWAVLQRQWQWILLSLGKSLKCCCSCITNFQPLTLLRRAGWNFQQIKYFNRLAADEAAAVCIVIRILSWYMRHFYCMRDENLLLTLHTIQICSELIINVSQWRALLPSSWTYLIIQWSQTGIWTWAPISLKHCKWIAFITDSLNM